MGKKLPLKPQKKPPLKQQKKPPLKPQKKPPLKQHLKPQKKSPLKPIKLKLPKTPRCTLLPYITKPQSITDFGKKNQIWLTELYSSTLCAEWTNATGLRKSGTEPPSSQISSTKFTV